MRVGPRVVSVLVRTSELEAAESVEPPVKYLVLSSLFLLSVLAGPVLALATAKPGASGPHLVIAWPWLDPAERVVAAGGSLVGPVSAPFAVLATSDDPGFANALSRAPGVTVRNGRQLAALCGVPV